MTSVNNIRIAARIYDDIGYFQTADNLDNLIKLAAEKTFRPVDFLKALPLAVGIGTLGNVVKPLPTQPPIMDQKLMDEQDLYDQYDEDSQSLENTFVKPKQKQIQKPVQRRLRPAPKLKFEPVYKPEVKKPDVKSEPFKATNQPKGNFAETMKLMLNLCTA